MTKILLVGDIHVSDRPPVNCYDSYTDDIIDMLTWTAAVASEMEVDAVVWAGDVFHHKAPSKNSHALVLKMVKVVQSYSGAGVDLWILPGNHDLSNDRLDSIHEKQPLGVLYAAGAYELNGWHPTLPLYGAPWQQDWPGDLKNAFAGFRMDTSRFDAPKAKCLAVTHASIFPPAMVGNVPYENLPAEDVAEAMGGEGSLYYGHIHDYHGQFSAGGVTFANMGAMSRGSLTESNTNRKIKVALWTDGEDETFVLPNGEKVSTLGEPGFIEIDVPHKPANEVFKLAEAAMRKDTERVLDDFLSSVGAATLEMSSVSSVIDYIESMDVDQRVKNLARTLLEDADS